MSIRRVATGEDAEGKSRIVSRLPVTPTKVDGVVEVAVIWGADSPPSFPVSAEIPQRTTYYPLKGGYRFVMLTLPPEKEASAARARLGPEALVAILGTLERELGAGMFALWDPDFSGMHINDSVDPGDRVVGKRLAGTGRRPNDHARRGRRLRPKRHALSRGKSWRGAASHCASSDRRKVTAGR